MICSAEDGKRMQLDMFNSVKDVYIVHVYIEKQLEKRTVEC